jgi:hypothetical protein
MGSGYSRSPFVLKGALVQFSAPMPIPVPIPNIILFQYNPESISRSFTAYDTQTLNKGAVGAGGETAVPVVVGDGQPFDPQETFSLSLLLDSSDALEVPEAHPVAFVAGVADRMAALEMLLYPSSTGGALQSAAASLFGAKTKAKEAAARTNVPTVLFVWGPGRIVPVRITGFTIDETQYNQLLYPHRAKISLQMRVLTPRDFPADGKAGDKVEYKIARFAYEFTLGQKQILALANIANTVESVIKMF